MFYCLMFVVAPQGPHALSPAASRLPLATTMNHFCSVSASLEIISHPPLGLIVFVSSAAGGCGLQQRPRAGEHTSAHTHPTAAVTAAGGAAPRAAAAV